MEEIKCDGPMVGIEFRKNQWFVYLDFGNPRIYMPVEHTKDLVRALHEALADIRKQVRGN